MSLLVLGFRAQLKDVRVQDCMQECLMIDATIISMQWRLHLVTLYAQQTWCDAM
jgi:hypothetical protein